MRLFDTPLVASGEGAGDRLRYAGQPLEILTGGAGFGGPGQSRPNVVAPPSSNGLVAGALSGQPHVGLIGLVLIAVALLILLDQAGFRFAVTAGKR